ncbi:sensor histidine kinase [Streptococcus halichoeri]|uniref:sensor histidine kinase n=1 Tax=Streptococcus halichoeri TaxID=254785 RepID=UPI001358876A|nr:sensor histidine kinase KdpD [Streptococcus halichoeri]
MSTGKLKIYFGYAAGVGKTYAMLEGAHAAKKAGLDVVSGYIEPHDRPETMRLLNGLEQLPPKRLIYKGITLHELDIDAALKRHPDILLVDELAHTNCPGSRNKKRYQDIKELLHAGIDVYTTVNVQHIDSLNDVIENITGIEVNERIPDAIFNQADKIELVDIAPLDLLERLDEGKIYGKCQAHRAKQHFFKEEKLIALREIALRKTADQINQSVIRADTVNKSITAKEHVLVCVSSSPYARHVIRAASRLASAFMADFTALYVGSLDEEGLESSSDTHLQQNLELAEQLGANISLVYAENVSKAIVDYAKVSHVTKLVVGKSIDRRFWPQENLVEVLSQAAPDLDIFVIPNARGKKVGDSLKPARKRSLSRWQFSMSDLWKTLISLIVVTVIGLLFRYWQFSVDNIITIYILGVQINAVWTKEKLSSVISSILSVLCFNYFFTFPYYTFQAFSPNYPITFMIMLMAGLITSSLINRGQEQARISTEKSYRTELLLQTNKALSKAANLPDILEAVAVQIQKLLVRDVVIYSVSQGTLNQARYFPSSHSTQTLQSYDQQKERGVAEWVLHNNKRAGATTNTLSAAHYLYLSIQGKDQVFAVIGILMAGKPALDAFEKSVLLAVLGEAALALEKENLREEQQSIRLKMQKEQLRANLLRAISHDLRTPLTSISGQARLMMEAANPLERAQMVELATYIYDDAMWLINLVENLLSITKLDGDVALTLSTNVFEEIVEEALKHIDRHVSQHHFQVHLSKELLMAKMDGALMVQVLINIINNAIKYTPPGSAITLTTKRRANSIVVEVADDGPGISDSDKQKIFELFYTPGQRAVDAKRGLGIGLSLCKSIITAHGGVIYARDNQPKGVIIGFTLPLVEVIV